MRSDDGVLEIGECTDHCVHPETVRHVRSRALPENDLAQVAAVFKLLGDPTRAKLLYALLEAGELCVCDLAASTGVAETTASQSLRLLRASQVVTARREGRLMYYRLADAHVRMLLDLTREHLTHEPDAGNGAEHVAAVRPIESTRRAGGRRPVRSGAEA
ncbi:metalloregulator ArsR/SmtB family transcription factor [Terrabacter aerolatus]|uniref:Transcriptional regulator n=1 Tax=Terrabacter aerolatus TaxID=422442 RepID=A0A512CY02_9MICO|nr:metalloregulator ArsR/SmtB family transcription factor [Terrabacter aerolatus]GEO29081.1 transcriptional regulator [Terrabacter aerolatus]